MRGTVRATMRLGCCAVMMLFSHAQSNGQNPPTQVSPMEARRQRIETKARLVNAHDESVIRDLADEVFNHPHSFPHLPTAMETFVKDRLVRAEMAYLDGSGKGVHEKEIVGLVNFLADRFGAPPYAKTSERQVRVLRLTLGLSLPTFMGRGMIRGDIKVGESIEPTMSPLQATHLIRALIDQKIMNPDYQFTSVEWEKDQYAKAIEKWRALRTLIDSGQRESLSKKAQAFVRTVPKEEDMRYLLSRRFSSMSLGDAWDTINQAFATLGFGQ